MILFKRFWILLALFLAGCAVNTQMVSLSNHEESVAINSFREMAASQKNCSPWVDAEVNVSLDSFFSSGTFDGYLQAMTPSYFKFVGTTPFGQPLLALSTNGKDFQFISFTGKSFYEGEVTAKAFSRFTPTGFDPADIYYWTIGRLGPGELRVVGVGGDVLNRGQWVELLDKESGKRSRVLFDPERKIILDHILLDSIGGVAMQAEYSDHHSVDCGLPGSITITGEEQSGKLILRLSDWQADTPFAVDDFKLGMPADFKKVTLK